MSRNLLGIVIATPDAKCLIWRDRPSPPLGTIILFLFAFSKRQKQFRLKEFWIASDRTGLICESRRCIVCFLRKNRHHKFKTSWPLMTRSWRRMAAPTTAVGARQLGGIRSAPQSAFQSGFA